MEKDLFTLINEKLSGLSKGHKLIANYILSHYDKAAFMTAQKLGKTVGVSESTVVRFASELGYDGYPALQKGLQELMRNKLTTVQRSAASIASFLAYYLGLIFPHVKLVQSTTTSELFEKIMRIDEKDAMIGISFPRYSKQTVKALKYAKSNGANVIAITDSKASPIAKYADSLLLARSDMASFVDSLVAPLSLINALIVAVSIRNIDRVSQTFERLEKVWAEYDVYAKSEEDTQ